MFGLGATELIIILVIVVVLFGAKRIPEIASGLGKGIVNFKKASSELEKETKVIEEDIKSVDADKEDNQKRTDQQ
ncbi:MAG: twin-arginine translocase TatA/TatE family subunit [Candidatus Aminicenantes bacterium]|nr:twin-arginine translocase TatA/TatE family subunit [Candidatus Aminicenantes bacterium]NIQ65087.1 twin-arginine translocase TatA/TatE family subunit [Candidatus Aminicenantes bacterium]NIT21088.1 twin-arginine translocase TatA/TatE family subunit [Candidatus Aminicenantes bacterium]